MTVETFFLLGAIGGSFRGVISLYGDFATWHQARRAHTLQRITGKAEGPVPRLAGYIDAVPELGATAVHVLLGGAVGIFFGATGQITGIYAAVLVGASAPALLTQMGQLKFVRSAFATNTNTEQPAAQSATSLTPRVPAQEVPQTETLQATIIPLGSTGERTADDI